MKARSSGGKTDSPAKTERKTQLDIHRVLIKQVKKQEVKPQQDAQRTKLKGKREHRHRKETEKIETEEKKQMHTKEHKMIFLYIEKQIGYRKRYLPSMTQV